MKRVTSLLLCLGLLFTFLAFPSAAKATAEFTTFEAAFKTWKGDWRGKNGPIKMQLKDDTMTFDYNPVFFFDKSFEMTDEEKDDFIERCVRGFKRWEGVYDIDGHAIEVIVNVTTGITDKKLQSSVQVLPPNGLASMVLGAVIWWPGSPLLTIFFRTSNPRTGFEKTAMHEFGHVLGIFDAYGYRAHFARYGLGDLADFLMPEAPEDRAPVGCVMDSGWNISSTEIEMILYAWSTGHLQLYTKNLLVVLGAKESPVFCK